MTFVKWPSIENTYRQRFVDMFLGEFPELANTVYILLEKLHGANFQFMVSSHRDVRAGSRRRYLESSSTFQGVKVADMLERYKPFLDQFQKFADDYETTYHLYGELIGPKIQKGVNYGSDKQILFFGLRMDEILQPFYILETFADLFGVPLVPVVGYAVGLNKALDWGIKFPSLLKPIPKNICEGVVIQPYHHVFQCEGGDYFLLKKKNNAVKEKAKSPKPQRPIDPEVDRLPAEFVTYITDSRLQSVFSKEGTIEEPSQIGTYIRLMIDDAREDFLKDHAAAWNVMDKRQRGRVTNVGRQVADMLKKYL